MQTSENVRASSADSKPLTGLGAESKDKDAFRTLLMPTHAPAKSKRSPFSFAKATRHALGRSASSRRRLLPPRRQQYLLYRIPPHARDGLLLIRDQNRNLRHTCGKKHHSFTARRNVPRKKARVRAVPPHVNRFSGIGNGLCGTVDSASVAQPAFALFRVVAALQSLVDV